MIEKLDSELVHYTMSVSDQASLELVCWLESQTEDIERRCRPIKLSEQRTKTAQMHMLLCIFVIHTGLLFHGWAPVVLTYHDEAGDYICCA